MRRSSADTRKRTERTIIDDARPCGLLTEDEIEEIRMAYLAGARGDILIGMKGEERVLTQLLPAQPDQHSAEQLLERSLEQLRAIGCDGYVHVRRVLVREGQGNPAVPAVKMAQRIRERSQEALWVLE